MHCEECHKEIIGMAQHIPKCDLVKPYRAKINCKVCPSEEIQKLGEKIRKKNLNDYVIGIFGDFPNRGYIEKYLITDKGRQMKFLGCTIPYRGVCKRETVDSIANVKRTLITSIEFALKYRFVFFFLLPFYKKFLKDCILWLTRIYGADLAKKTYKSLDEFSPVTQELLRVGIKKAEEIPLEACGAKKCDGRTLISRQLCGGHFRNECIQFIWCLVSFIQFDHAYYYRVHDFFNQLDIINFKKNPRKELNNLFELCIGREHQIQEKLKLCKKVVNYAMLFPPTKQLLISYIQSLDYDKFIPDDNDRYWYGRREGYDFEGKSFKDRTAFSENMDRKLKNVIIR